MAGASVIKNYGKSILIVFLFAGICVALLLLINSTTSVDLSVIGDSSYLIPAIVLQVFATFLFILAWKILLSMRPDSDFGFAECTSHIGVTLMGKYLPGKIWGLVGRTYLLTRRGQSSSEAVSLLIADQFLTFYSGIAIGVLALLAFFFSELAIIAVLIAIFTTPVIVKFYAAIIHWLLHRSKLFLKRLSQKIEPEAVKIDRALFTASLLTYAIHWFCTSVVLCLLFYPVIASQLFLNVSLIIAAIPLAVLSGFIAIWAPGGIGVREGVIVMILSLNMPIDLAASIAITYRLICVVNDLSTGCFALFYFSRTAPSLLRESD